MNINLSPISKRVRFVLASLLLTFGLAFLSFPPYNTQIYWVFLLSLLSLFVANFVIGGAVGIERFTLLVLPVSLTLGASFSQFFFPNFNSVFKAVGWVSFFLAIYATFLALNVFKVIRIKGETIPLKRAARPTVFLLSFVAAFLLLTAIHKLSLGVWLETPLVFVIGFSLSLSFLWALTASDIFVRDQMLGAFLVGVGLVQAVVAFSFHPWKAFLQGLAEATFFYALLGVSRAYLERHLKYSIVFEYIAIILVVFLLISIL
jgi:hypothetical protein